MREKEVKLKQLRADLALMQETRMERIVEQQRTDRRKDLNMKLVTLKTRLVEAEENKTNYSLYFLRMKEEDVILSKNIEVLRNMVKEYDRLLKKTALRNQKIINRKIALDDEIIVFNREIDNFSAFAGHQLSQYRRLVVLTGLGKGQPVHSAGYFAPGGVSRVNTSSRAEDSLRL